jgi:hypothetical protein
MQDTDIQIKLDNQITAICQSLVTLHDSLTNLMVVITSLKTESNFDELCRTDKSASFMVDCIKKGKIVTNDIGRV